MKTDNQYIRPAQYKKGSTVPILIAIIIILIGVGFFYVIGQKNSAQNNSDQNASTTDQTGNNEPTSTITPVHQTSNWKTYTDTQNQFTIKYPSNWIFETGVGGTIVRFRDPSQIISADSVALVDQVFIRQGQACNSSDWSIGFGDLNYKYICINNLNLGIDMVALHENSKAIEQKIVDSFVNNSSSQRSVTKQSWGISFPIPSGWNVTNNVDSQVVLTEISSGDRITLDYTRSSIYSDIDAKFGAVTYEFNDDDGIWYQMNDSGTGPKQSFTKAIPQFYLYESIPVFLGTSRWKTYIIPISDTVFLKVNITGSGNTIPIDSFIKSIKIIG